MTSDLLIKVLLGIVGFLLVRLLSKLEDGNIKLANIEVKIAELNITVKNYDKEIDSLKEWQLSQDKEIIKLRERQHDLSDKLNLRIN